MATVGFDPGFKKRAVTSFLSHPNHRTFYDMTDDTGSGNHYLIGSEVETGGLLPQIGTGGEAYPISSRHDPHPRSPVCFDYTSGDKVNGYTAYIRQDFNKFPPVSSSAYNWAGLVEYQTAGGGVAFGTVPGLTTSADYAFTQSNIVGAYQVRVIMGGLFSYYLADGSFYFLTLDLDLFITAGWPDNYPADAKVRAVSHGPNSFIIADAAGWNDGTVTPLVADGTFYTKTVRWQNILTYLAATTDSATTPAVPYIPTPRDGWGGVTCTGVSYAFECTLLIGSTFQGDLGLRNMHSDINIVWTLGSSQLGINTVLG